MLLLLFSSQPVSPCQYVLRRDAVGIYTARLAAAGSGGDDGEFPGVGGMPEGGGGGGTSYTRRTAAVGAFTIRTPASGTGIVCAD